MSKTLMMPRPLSYCESHMQNPTMVAELDRLLDDYNYADVARMLNEKGYKTGDGLPLTSPAVESRFDRFVNEACLLFLRRHDTTAFQQTQFLIGDERIVSVRMPLTTETNFSLKIPARIHPGSTSEEFRVLTVLHRMLRDPEIEREPGVVRAQPGAEGKISARGMLRN
jgi:hypothetical protein